MHQMCLEIPANIHASLPIWFQAIQGTNAVGSGIRLIASILSFIVFSTISGILVTILGHYTPFVWLSAILMSIGAGLLATLEIDSHAGQWIGYQVIFGVGVGLGYQQVYVSVQNVLPPGDIPIATALMSMAQNLGGAIFVSVAARVFTTRLLANLDLIPGLDAQTVVGIGATGFRQIVPATQLPAVYVAYNGAIRDTLYVAVAISVASAFAAVFIELKSIKGARKDTVAIAA
jgi:hypothetical protein